MVAIASALPLECFNNTQPNEIVLSLAKMDTINMDEFRKGFITAKIIASNSTKIIQSLLATTSDPTIINSIPTSTLASLDLTQVSASNLPTSFVYVTF
jgi:hypothetical protein